MLAGPPLPLLFLFPLSCPKCPKLNYQIWLTLYGLDGSLTWVCMYTQQCNVHTRKNQRWQIANLRLQGKVDHVIDRVRPQLYLWRCCVHWGKIISKVICAVTLSFKYVFYTSWLETRFRGYRLFMKGKFDVYIYVTVYRKVDFLIRIPYFRG